MRSKLLVSCSALATLAACAVDVPETPPAGALQLALTQTASDGQLYHLRGEVSVSGETDGRWATPEDAPTLRAELAAGDYQLTLEPGWQLERVTDAGPEPVVATLVSDNPQPFTITADTTTELTLRFLLDGEVLKAIVGAVEVSLAVDVPPPACEPRLVLNEVDYDQEGADDAELIELFNAGDCAVPTEGLALVLHNGGTTDGVPAPYATLPLASAGSEIAAGGYLVVADAAVLAALDPAVPALELTTALQNGDPDGISLELDGQILDAMSYGGVMDGVTEGASAPKDPGAGVLARCPNGHDSDDNAVDFALLPEPSAGAPNPCP